MDGRLAAAAMRLLRGLTRNRTATRAVSPDPRLRGRVYADAYAEVWQAARHVAASLPGWTVVHENPGTGELRAEARTRLWRFTDDVTIRLSLTADGLTCVDAASASRAGRTDFGANARRIARFLHALDRHLRQLPLAANAEPAPGGACAAAAGDRHPAHRPRPELVMFAHAEVADRAGLAQNPMTEQR